MRARSVVLGGLCALVGVGLGAAVVHLWEPVRHPPSAPSVSLSAASLQFTRPAGDEEGLLALEQIRWCLREELRISTLGARLRTDEGIARLNERVADYNRRCGTFRYDPATLQVARRDIEGMRSRIVAAAQQEVAALDAAPTPADERPAALERTTEAAPVGTVPVAPAAVPAAFGPTRRTGGAVDLVLIVVDEELGAAEAAEVRVWTAAGFQTDSLTNDLGRARLVDVPSGPLQIEVQRAGDPLHYRFRSVLEPMPDQEVHIVLPPL